MVSVAMTTLLLQCKSNHRQCVNGGMWLCFNETVFTKQIWLLGTCSCITKVTLRFLQLCGDSDIQFSDCLLTSRGDITSSKLMQTLNVKTVW